MDNIFVYWDNSNIFHEAQRIAEEKNNSPSARYRVRLHFDNLLKLATADRTLKSALAAGSIPPEMRNLWNRMENSGVEVHLFDRGNLERGEQEVPDLLLQNRMTHDCLRYLETPGIVVLLTGDGAGYSEGQGFHTTLELLHNRGWGVEVLSWRHSCKRRMREWAENNGVFIALDDYYDSITFLEPSRPGHPLAPERPAGELDLQKRPRFNVSPT
ncbi:MAG: NYN domain-containing protein [Aestuariivita sp.]|nr:NYN domain-containing protein [Aestuariivita sp.]MCY4204016.1 NYN domain-containing protein [Aestuariivita sp.]MCY4289748.1 NYN domain-containing protein [Aestuariivita sp.]MCY4347626.1 NYN domain-containing protein [Aestuariivita sp.]